MEEPAENKPERDPRQFAAAKVFGKNVRRRREHLQLSQEAFGHHIGVDRTYVLKLEKGKVNPKLDTIVRLAQALNVTTSVLLRGTEKVELPPPPKKT